MTKYIYLIFPVPVTKELQHKVTQVTICSNSRHPVCEQIVILDVPQSELPVIRDLLNKNEIKCDISLPANY